jgi:hypothetical protein
MGLTGTGGGSSGLEAPESLLLLRLVREKRSKNSRRLARAFWGRSILWLIFGVFSDRGLEFFRADVSERKLALQARRDTSPFWEDKGYILWNHGSESRGCPTVLLAGIGPTANKITKVYLSSSLTPTSST